VKSNRRKHLENGALLGCSLVSITVGIMFIVHSKDWGDREWAAWVVVYLTCIAACLVLGAQTKEG
jgi:heme/copper-type cytochrome/quinol oxidase subunit 4